MTNAKVIPASEVEVGMEITSFKQFRKVVKKVETERDWKTIGFDFWSEDETYIGNWDADELVAVKQPELDIDPEGEKGRFGWEKDRIQKQSLIVESLETDAVVRRWATKKAGFEVSEAYFCDEAVSFYDAEGKRAPTICVEANISKLIKEVLES